jgi:hypothetical protein
LDLLISARPKSIPRFWPLVAKRFPPGWDLNPSAWEERLPIAGAAFIGACFPSGGGVEDKILRLLLVSVIVLCFLGGERRWIKTPIPVLAFGLVTGPVLFFAAALSFIHMATFLNWSGFGLLRSLIAILIIGPAMDEVLATLQYLRRRVFHGARDEAS